MPRGPHGELLGDDRPPEPADIQARFFGPHPGDEGPKVALQQPTRIILPPHYYPPMLGAQALNPFGSAFQAGPNLNWTVPAGVQYQVPLGYVAVVRVVGFALLNMLATTDVRMSLRFAGASQAPVRRIPAQPVAYVERSWDTFAYVVPQRTLIDVMITVVDAGGYTITAYYEGWTFPLSEWAVFTASVS